MGAFAGAASAQSSVTIYGQIDQGVTKGNGGTAANAGANGTSEAWQLKQAHSSRVGFRGNEDLGGGLSAQFLLEHRFQPDTGAGSGAAGTPTAPSVFWDGGSYVQLTSSAAGSIYFGRWYTPAFYVALKTDPFGWDGIGQVGSKAWAGYLTPGPTPAGATAGTGVRTSNTVGYKTPNLGGFTANVAVGLGEAVVGRDQGFNAEYTAGPLYVGIGYEKINEGPVATKDNSLVIFGIAYDFKFVRPMFAFSRSKIGAGNIITGKFMEAALTAPIGAGILKAAYYTEKPDGPTAAQSLQEKKFGIGYDYYLSKRTRIYADLSQAKQDTKTNNSAYMVGVRHDF
ncbi:MAG: porin [Rhizobacter sp.]